MRVVKNEDGYWLHLDNAILAIEEPAAPIALAALEKEAAKDSPTTDADLTELAACVGIDYNNLKSTMPALKQHPMSLIFEIQFKELMKKLEVDEAFLP